MKKPIDNSDKPTSKDTQLDPLSNSNESNLTIDGVDDFEFAFSNLEYRKIIKDYKYTSYFEVNIIINDVLDLKRNIKLKERVQLMRSYLIKGGVPKSDIKISSNQHHSSFLRALRSQILLFVLL